MTEPRITHHASRLLFIHGWATDSWVWKEQVKEFSKGYDAVTVDLPGHNVKRVKGQGSRVSGNKWSEPTLQPAIDEILRITHHASRFTKSPLLPFFKRGCRGIVGIGWSLGASVLMATAVKYPKLFKGLVLIGATPCFVKRDNFPHAQPKSLVKRMLKDLKNAPKKTLARFYPLNFTEKELAKKNAQEFIGHYNISHLTSHISLFSSLEALLNMDLRNDIKNINIPTLVIHGDKDMVCPVGAGKYLAKNIKGASLKIFKNTGHAPFITTPEEFNKEVKGFLKTS